MKLRNKKTGEIAEASILNFELVVRYDDGRVEKYPLLFNYSNFEYYEEPKEHWAIDQFGEPINVSGLSRLQLEKLHRLGNDFPSENATMKAIEKLKAWKRLKDKGFRYKDFEETDRGELGDFTIYAHIEPDYSQKYDEFDDDLYLLFGGEE